MLIQYKYLSNHNITPSNIHNSDMDVIMCYSQCDDKVLVSVVEDHLTSSLKEFLVGYSHGW